MESTVEKKPIKGCIICVLVKADAAWVSSLDPLHSRTVGSAASSRQHPQKGANTHGDCNGRVWF